jgi:addiction module RelE/StbE family toxin
MSRGAFEVLWAEAAIRDLEQIVDYIAQEAPLAAERLFDDIAEKSQTLESLPRRGRVVPELGRFKIMTYRELVLRPYRLMYRIDGKRVLVAAVFDGRRNLEDAILARLNRG